jgi:hypothetical protein
LARLETSSSSDASGSLAAPPSRTTWRTACAENELDLDNMLDLFRIVVMAGLVPAIHVLPDLRKDVDTRDKRRQARA